MSEIPNEEVLEEKPAIVADNDIFTKIWTEPRRVLTFIHHYQYDKYFTVLMIMAGIVNGFNRAETRGLGDRQSLSTIIMGSVVGGAVLGWLTYYIYAALVSWTGKWLGAEGKTSSIVRVLAYGSIPAIVAAIFIIPPIAIYGVENFKSYGDITTASTLENVIVYGCMVGEAILGIWTIVLSIVGISVVQKISIGNAILNALLPVVIVAIPLWTVVMLLRSF